jgi:hypothetical protein
MTTVEKLRENAVSQPAFVLVAGRTMGFVVSFAIPVVLARLFSPRILAPTSSCLIYATVYGLAQVGMAESPLLLHPSAARRCRRHRPTRSHARPRGRRVRGAPLRGTNGIAAWMTNPDLSRYLPLLAVFLACSLVSVAFEIVMVSRKDHVAAATVYAGSDFVRTACLIVPALAIGSLRGVLAGAAAYAALRLAAMLVYFWREFGSGLRCDSRLWRGQFVYALPFGLAVAVEIVQANLHQYFVASRFNAETFAIYAVGCLQIPLVDP